eukprot:tig00020564_g11412.t1
MSLLEAVQKGQVEDVRRLLADGADANALHEGHLGENFSALYSAAGSGKLELCRILLDAGADPKAPVVFKPKGGGAAVNADLPPDRGMQPLHVSSLNGHLEVVRFLLERGVDPAALAYEDGYKTTKVTALHLALSRADRGGSQIEVARLLHEKGCPMDLRHASLLGELPVVQRLLESNPDVNEPDEKGYAALHLASKYGHAEVVRVLLAAGADPKKSMDPELNRGKIGMKYPPLQAACSSGRADVVQLLLDAGVDVNVLACPEGGYSDRDTRTALHVACAAGHEAVVRLLLANGADTAVLSGYRVVRTIVAAGPEDTSGETALHAAARGGSAAIVRLLAKEFGMDVNAQGEFGCRPLHVAVTHSRLDAARPGVPGGAPPLLGRKLALRLRHAPLLAGDLLDRIRKERIPVLQLLVDAGANVNHGLVAGRPTPLFSAAQAGNVPLVRLLLAAKADPNPPAIKGSFGRQGGTVLSVGTRSLDPDLVKALLDAGADPNAADEDGGTPLLELSLLGIKPAVRDVALLLLERGADAAAKARDGSTPLLMLFRSGRGAFDSETARSLAGEFVRRGAGQTPLAAAAQKGKMDEVACARTAARPRRLSSRFEFTLRSISVYLLGVEADGVASGALPPPGPPPARDSGGALAGVPGGVFAAAAFAIKAGRVDLVSKAADWLVACVDSGLEGDFAALGRTAEAEDQPECAALAAGGARVAALLSGKKGEGAADGAGESPAPANGDTALIAACRAGLRGTALRLAAAAAGSVDERNGAGETALFHCVRLGRPMLDVALLLIQRGADLTLRVGTGASRMLLTAAFKLISILDATADASLRAELKGAAKVRDVFISYGHHPPEVANFTRRLRDELERRRITCWMDEMKPSGIEAGTEWRDAIGEGVKAAQAVVFVASRHSCKSDWCMRELARARDLGRRIYPVWREKVELQDQLKGYLLPFAFTDFSEDALFERDLPAFVESLQQTIDASSSGSGGEKSAEAASAAALLAMPEARCKVGDASDHLVLWCSPKDAAFARVVVLGLRDRGVSCWVDCLAPVAVDGAHARGAPPGSDSDAEVETAAAAAAAVASCAAFVPLLSPASIAEHADELRSRLQLASQHRRPLRPAALQDFAVPASLEYSLAQSPGFCFLTEETSTFFPSLDLLVASLPRPADVAPAAAAPAQALGQHGAAAAVARVASGASKDRQMAAELAACEEQLRAARRETAELEAETVA